MANLVPFDKLLCTITASEQTIRLTTGYEDIRAIKVNWYQYVTASTGGQQLTITIDEFSNAGTSQLNTGGNRKYFFAQPIDPSLGVTNLYGNPFQTYDKYFQEPIAFNQLSVHVSINGILTNDLSPSNPLTIELGLYINPN